MKKFFLTIICLLLFFFVGNEAKASDSATTSASSTNSVLINEVVSSPMSGQNEWLELYNNSDKSINLNGWYIMEGNEAKTILAGSIEADGYFLADSIKGNLNNGGDIIYVYNKEGILMDELVYGDWPGAKISAPKKGESIARSNSNEYLISSLTTPGITNTIRQDLIDKKTFAQSKNQNYSRDILISEILPNPKGVDVVNEYIELFNRGKHDISLAGWHLGDNSSIVYFFPEKTIIKANDYLVIKRPKSKLTLGNNKDTVKLFQPNSDDPYIKVSFRDAPEDMSWSLDLDELSKKYHLPNNEWAWSSTLTPGSKNIITKTNRLPLINVVFPENVTVGNSFLYDSSDTFDEDGDELSFLWDFGDGIQLNLANPYHYYKQPGEHVITLDVGDGQATTTLSQEIIVFDKIEKLPEARTYGNVIINEIMPNPDGPDNKGEWIELFNTESYNINLVNWVLDDAENGSKPYTFTTQYIASSSYLLIPRSQSNLALNNTNDEVRLFSSNNKPSDSLIYDETFAGKSLSRVDNEWLWTSSSTPGEKNCLTQRITGQANSPQINNTEEAVYEISLFENKQEFDKGDAVIAEGIVSVLPDVFGSQYFYITDLDNSSGIQVYNYHKKFPALAIGDLVSVRGETSYINDELRIKTKDESDIVVLDSDYKLDIIKLDSNIISDEIIGTLIKVAGEVVDKKNSLISIDDGQGEIDIYIKEKTGIDKKTIQRQDRLIATGLVAGSKNGPRVLPRSNSDIKIIAYTEPAEEVKEIGEVIEIKPGTYNNKISALYLIMAVSTIIVFAWFYKNRIKKT